MLASPCPECGRPSPIAVAEPERMRCVACGYQGPPPAETTRRLRAAAQVLAGLDVRKRQLTHAQQRALRVTGCLIAVFVALLVIFLIGYGGFTALVLFYVLTDEYASVSMNAWLTIVLVAPVLIVVAADGFGIWLVRSKRRKLQDACAATPPAAAGEPARCHVCGAPLASAGTAASVRCAYCQADNIVAPDVLARASRAKTVILDHYEQAVSRRAVSAGATAVAATVLAPVVVIMAPIVVFVALVVVVVTLNQFEQPHNPDARYVVVQLGQRRCIGRYYAELAEGRRIRLTGSFDESAVAAMDPATATKPVAASWFVGKQAIRYVDDQAGRIEAVYTATLIPDENMARFITDDGHVDSMGLDYGLCLHGADAAAEP